MRKWSRLPPRCPTAQGWTVFAGIILTNISTWELQKNTPCCLRPAWQREGLKPFCAIYSTFLQRAFDPVVHDVCLQNLPVVFCMDRGGLSGDDGPDASRAV